MKLFSLESARKSSQLKSRHMGYFSLVLILFNSNQSPIVETRKPSLLSIIYI
jgi:hypothetical protein